MKTTSYVIELLISGFGAALWIIMIFGLFNQYEVEYFEYLTTHLPLLIILFPSIYTVGIVTDRFVDNAFNLLFYHKYASSHFSSTEEFIEARSIIYIHSENLKELFEYSKMKMRICRGWTFNSLVIGLLALPFILTQDFICGETIERIEIINAAAITAFFIGSSLITFHAWKHMAKRECEYLRIQSRITAKIHTTASEHDKANQT